MSAPDKKAPAPAPAPVASPAKQNPGVGEAIARWLSAQPEDIQTRFQDEVGDSAPTGGDGSEQ